MQIAFNRPVVNSFSFSEWIDSEFGQDGSEIIRKCLPSRHNKIAATGAVATLSPALSDGGIGRDRSFPIEANQLIADTKLSHYQMIVSAPANDQRPTANDGSYALAASWPPRGRKYCVPLIGAETLRNSSCRSSLRSTKSISEVFTIRRSDDV